MDLAEVSPADSQERELSQTVVFRALEPVTEQVTAALFRAAGQTIEPSWAAVKEQAVARLKKPVRPD
jgi:hypothetical protein